MNFIEFESELEKLEYYQAYFEYCFRKWFMLLESEEFSI
jgi:hypothetical protein